jgi:hypothetical protein
MDTVGASSSPANTSRVVRAVKRCFVLLRSVEIELAALQCTLVLLSEICFGFGQRLERSR